MVSCKLVLRYFCKKYFFLEMMKRKNSDVNDCDIHYHWSLKAIL